MDIVTHAGIGLVVAAPFIASQPELALGFAAGSVLPDLDALVRVFGKRAFLRIHQTWSHALPIELLIFIASGCIAHWLGANGLTLGAGLLAGLLMHTFLDSTNTLGVRLFAPFSKRRFCLEAVFFIDAFVLTLTFTVLGVTTGKFLRTGEVPPRYAALFLAMLAAYIFVKTALRRRARRFAPEALSLIPSALYPWRFFGVERRNAVAELFEINPVTGQREFLRQQQLLDSSYECLLVDVPEFVLMRELSPAYHVVEAHPVGRGERILCRDLRTRNFGTTFGDLEIFLDPTNASTTSISMHRTAQRPRTWGFRFSAPDAVVISVVAAIVIPLHRAYNPLWWLLVLVTGHFFLFCNIIRLRRRYEILWAVLFLLNLTFWLLLGRFDSLRVIAVQPPITVCVVLMELRSNRYHGVFAKRTNPHLNDYLEGRIL